MAKSRFRTRVEPVGRGLSELQDLVDGLDYELVDRVDKALAEVRTGVRHILRRVPGSPVHPIDWTSPKQRRAYWASNGFGRGIPTRRRTGGDSVVGSWDTRTRKSRGEISLEIFNDHPAYDYVYGAHQQKFHRDTGWLDEEQIVYEVEEYVERTVPQLVDVIVQDYLG